MPRSIRTEYVLRSRQQQVQRNQQSQLPSPIQQQNGHPNTTTTLSSSYSTSSSSSSSSPGRSMISSSLGGVFMTKESSAASLLLPSLHGHDDDDNDNDYIDSQSLPGISSALSQSSQHQQQYYNDRMTEIGIPPPPMVRSWTDPYVAMVSSSSSLSFTPTINNNHNNGTPSTIGTNNNNNNSYSNITSPHLRSNLVQTSSSSTSLSLVSSQHQQQPTIQSQSTSNKRPNLIRPNPSCNSSLRSINSGISSTSNRRKQQLRTTLFDNNTGNSNNNNQKQDNNNNNNNKGLSYKLSKLIMKLKSSPTTITKSSQHHLNNNNNGTVSSLSSVLVSSGGIVLPMKLRIVLGIIILNYACIILLFTIQSDTNFGQFEKQLFLRTKTTTTNISTSSSTKHNLLQHKQQEQGNELPILVMNGNADKPIQFVSMEDNYSNNNNRSMMMIVTSDHFSNGNGGSSYGDQQHNNAFLFRAQIPHKPYNDMILAAAASKQLLAGTRRNDINIDIFKMMEKYDNNNNQRMVFRDFEYNNNNKSITNGSKNSNTNAMQVLKEQDEQKQQRQESLVIQGKKEKKSPFVITKHNAVPQIQREEEEEPQQRIQKQTIHPPDNENQQRKQQQQQQQQQRHDHDDANIMTDLHKGTSHRLEDGDDNVLLVIISNRIDGIIPSLASIIHTSTKPVDVVLVGEHDINEQVHKHFGNRIHSFTSMTVQEVTKDLERNANMKPIWTWPEWHTTINNDSWMNENTIHIAEWDSLPTHSHELNHLRFYLPYVSIFQNKGYLYFMDDDILVQKDLGLVAADVMRNLPSNKGLVTPCNIWLWDSHCHHFDFHDRDNTILDMPSLYGDRGICQSPYETHCYPDNYIDFIDNVVTKVTRNNKGEGKRQFAWNFGFSLFALNNWRQLQLTHRYEYVMKQSYEKHVFPETSLTFGLGVPYLAFAGAVECWNDNNLIVRDGFGFIEWNRYQATFGENFFERIDVLHFTGPDKPWVANSTIEQNSVQAWLRVMAKENLPIPDQLSTVPSTNLFALLASDRTGAQWLMNTLDSHPQVCASGEADKPETGFSTDILLPTGLPWYQECSIKRGCTYAFIVEAVGELVHDMADSKVPRRCTADYDPIASRDPYVDHLERLCNFVEMLQGNYTLASIGRVWVDAFVAEDGKLMGCSCPRGTLAKGLKVAPEWLIYDNFPAEFNGPPKLILDDSKLHGSKIIRLKRNNLWARYKSMVMAQKSGLYHVQSAEDKQLQESNVEKVSISIEDMEWTISHMIHIDKFGDEWAEKHGSEVLWIVYEDCRDDTPSCFRQIFEFLGVDQKYVQSKGKKFESSFADLHLDESLDHIENSEAVKEALAVNGWGHFVNLGPDYHVIQLFLYNEAGTLAKPHQVKGINTTIYGQNLEADSHSGRFEAAIPLLRSVAPDTLVVISDDLDVLINYPSGSDELRYKAIADFQEAFMELSQEHSSSIIVSAESDCCASALTHVSPGAYFDEKGRRVGRACWSGASDCQWGSTEKALTWQSFMKELASKRQRKEDSSSGKGVYLSGRLIAGKARDLLDLIKNLQILKSEDERAVLTDYMYRNPDKIVLDYGGRMFGNNFGRPNAGLSNEWCPSLDRVDATSQRHLTAHDRKGSALFIHRPRDITCYLDGNNRVITRFPRWGKEGIQLRPILEHFGRVDSGKEMIVLPSSYGRVPDYRQGPEVPYVIDANGVFSSNIIRNRTDQGTFQFRLRPTEFLVKLSYRILRRVCTQDEKSRWRNLLRSIESGGGFVYWAWYGDFKSCNQNNYDDKVSIPVLTTAARTDCNYAFPVPNYMTIIDTQRNSNQWLGVFEQYAKQYPWEKKIPKAVWRGSLSESEWHNVFMNVRWRFCQAVQLIRGDLFDVGLTSVSDQITNNVFVNTAEVGGLVKGITPMTEFMRYRAIVDMDGNSWSSRFGSLLCYNSVIIKIEPQYNEYFIPELIPWTHYIPVKNDLSDLEKNVEWAIHPDNDSVVQEIIRSANQFCAQRFTPSSLAHDLLDTWESYIEMLDRGNSKWSEEWTNVKKLLFEPNSKAGMVQI